MLRRTLAIAIGCIALLTGCSHPAPEEKADEAPATPVQATAARTGTIERVASAEGILFPAQQADIVPKISAPVIRYAAQRGDHVRRGQLLAVLENKDLVAAQQEASQLYEQAQSVYENTKSATLPNDLTKATTDERSAEQALEAARKLYENRLELVKQGALAQKLADDAKVALVQAQSQYDTAHQNLNTLQSVGRREQLRSAEAQVQAAKARLEAARANVGYSEVRSVIDGMVSDRPLNVGEMASAGSALFSVEDISRIVVRANFAVQDAALIKRGRAATITGPGAELTGKVTVVSPAVDPNSTTVQVWVEARNTNEALKPGATATVTISIGEVTNAVIVPVAALLATEEGGQRVLVAGSDGLAHESKVQLGVRNGDDVQILAGVKPGDNVIVEGGLGLDDKAKVKVGTPEDKQ